MLSPAYHPNLDGSRLPVSAIVDTGISLPFLVLCLVLSNGGIIALGKICFWPTSQYMSWCVFMSGAAAMLCMIGYGQVDLEITESHVGWAASRIPFVTSRWRESLLQLEW